MLKTTEENEECETDNDYCVTVTPIDEKDGYFNHTRTHILKVQENISSICSELTNRGLAHDRSKFTEEESDLLSAYYPKLKKSTFMSADYLGFMEYLKPALTLHYQRNRHHPEHFKNGMEDMNLIDILELLCDWYAATKNHNDGNILVSIEVNQKRFGYSDSFKEMLKSTCRYMGWLDS